jgi:hypothetical protein
LRTFSILFLALACSANILSGQEIDRTPSLTGNAQAAQQQEQPATAPRTEQAPVSTANSPISPERSSDQRPRPPFEHRFWDKQNDWLFSGVGATRTLDYFSTLNFRRRGRQEIFLTNDAVDNHAGFAFIEAGAAGVSVGVSYIFHRYGHHRLERWTSYAHIGFAATGAVRNYCLKTAHPVPARP